MFCFFFVLALSLYPFCLFRTKILVVYSKHMMGSHKCFVSFFYTFCSKSNDIDRRSMEEKKSKRVYNNRSPSLYYSGWQKSYSRFRLSIIKQQTRNTNFSTTFFYSFLLWRNKNKILFDIFMLHARILTLLLFDVYLFTKTT